MASPRTKKPASSAEREHFHVQLVANRLADLENLIRMQRAQTEKQLAALTARLDRAGAFCRDLAKLVNDHQPPTKGKK